MAIAMYGYSEVGYDSDSYGSMASTLIQLSCVPWRGYGGPVAYAVVGDQD